MSKKTKEKKDNDGNETRLNSHLMPLLGCPCGKIPKKLHIVEGSSCKWAWVSGDCCGDWNVEFRTHYHKIDTPECMEQAIIYWNAANRAV